MTKSKKNKNIVNSRYFRFQTWVCKNVSNEVLLVWFKYQAKNSSRSGVSVLREWQKCTLPSPPLSKDEGLRDINHIMSTGNLIWGVNSVTISYLIRYDNLLQNAADIITKWGTILLDIITNATEIYYKMGQVLYYKMRQFYYKMQQLLQIVTILL